jgi:hypothetical protein
LPITVHVREQRPGESHVSTREGITPVREDDLIMRGVQGEEYPIGREVFSSTYRMGEATQPAATREAVEPTTATEARLARDWYLRGCDDTIKGVQDLLERQYGPPIVIAPPAHAPPAATREAGPLPQAEISDEKLADIFAQGCRDGASDPDLPPFLAGARAVWDRAVLARWGGAAVPAADEGENDLSPCQEFALRLYRLLEQFNAELFYTNADDGVHFEINIRKPSAGFFTRAELRDLLIDAGLLSAADKGEVQP